MAPSAGALELELERARYAATLAARRYEAVDRDPRLVAVELEARWKVALERVERLELRLTQFVGTTAPPFVDRDLLLSLAEDLPAVWNDPAVEPRLNPPYITS